MIYRTTMRSDTMKNLLTAIPAKLRSSIAASIFLLGAVLSFSSQAAVIQYSGQMTTTTGVFETFIPAPLPAIDGFIEFDDTAIAAGIASASDILSMEMNIGAFCVATDIAACAPGLLAMPVTAINFSAVTFTAGAPTGGSMLATGVLTSPIQLTLPLIFSFDAGVWFTDGGPFGTLAGTGELISPIPIPAAAWLFGSALLALGGLKRKTA